MIKSIEIINDENILLRVVLANGKTQYIKYDALQKYWNYASNEDVEGINITSDDKYIVICLTTAQMQGGIVAVWDIDASKVVHYQNGDYAIVAQKTKNKILTICEISNYSIKPYALLSVCDFGVKDIECSGETYNLNFISKSQNFSYDNYKIICIEDKVIAQIEENKQVFSAGELGVL